MEKEIWKDIKGYEDDYMISSYGRVRSVDRMKTLSNGVKRLHKGRILKPKKDKYGYLICSLSKNSKLKSFTVHRLVAEAFIQNPDNFPIINHKDENPTNNFASNLEWCDFKYNSNYGTAIQRRAEKRSKTVLQIDKETGQVIAEYPSTQEAARKLNICQSTISECCNGKRNTAGGFKWQYK